MDRGHSTLSPADQNVRAMANLYLPCNEKLQFDYPTPDSLDDLFMPLSETMSVNTPVTSYPPEQERNKGTPPMTDQEKVQHRRIQIRRAGQRHRQQKAHYLSYLEKTVASQKSDLANGDAELVSLRQEVKCLKGALARGIFSGFASNYYGSSDQESTTNQPKALKLFVTVLVQNPIANNDCANFRAAGGPGHCSDDIQYNMTVGSSFATTPADLCQDTPVDLDSLLRDQYYPAESQQAYL